MATRQDIRLRAARKAFVEARKQLHAYLAVEHDTRRYDPDAMDIARMSDAAARATSELDRISERRATR